MSKTKQQLTAELAAANERIIQLQEQNQLLQRQADEFKDSFLKQQRMHQDAVSERKAIPVGHRQPK